MNYSPVSPFLSHFPAELCSTPYIYGCKHVSLLFLSICSGSTSVGMFSAHVRETMSNWWVTFTAFTVPQVISIGTAVTSKHYSRYPNKHSFIQCIVVFSFYCVVRVMGMDGWAVGCSHGCLSVCAIYSYDSGTYIPTYIVIDNVIVVTGVVFSHNCDLGWLTTKMVSTPSNGRC